MYVVGRGPTAKEPDLTNPVLLRNGVLRLQAVGPVSLASVSWVGRFSSFDRPRDVTT